MTGEGGLYCTVGCVIHVFSPTYAVEENKKEHSSFCKQLEGQLLHKSEKEATHHLPGTFPKQR